METTYRIQPVGDVDVLYRESGAPDAPVVLLLHGFPSSSHMFRELIPELSKDHRVIAPDLPGFGRTMAPARGAFDYSGLQGSLAEYAAVDADLLAPKPTNLSMRQAAALPLVIITAWEGMIDRAQTRAEQSVLVHGGAGGVGHVTVQIAVALGAKVFATVGAANADIVRGYGATPIDYRNTPVAQYVDGCTGGRGFDVIDDTVGGSTLDDSSPRSEPMADTS